MGPEIFNRLRRLALPLAAALATLAAVPAQAQDSTAANTEAVILTSGSIVGVADMDFGQIVPSGTAGTVTLSASATPTCAASGGIVHSGACQAARFAIFGKKNDRVRLRDTSNGSIVLTGPGGASMSVTDVTLGVVGMSPSSNGNGNGGGNGWNLGTWQIDTANGTTDFFLGGRLNVSAMQAPGGYTGTVLIEAVFN